MKPSLPGLGLVKDLSEEERAEFASHGEFTVVDAGEEVISEGANQDSLYFVISGMLHVQIAPMGRTIFLGKLKTGDAIGEMAILDPGPASASVVAKEMSQLWKISREEVLDFVQNSPAAAAKVLFAVGKQLSKRLRQTNEKAAMAQESIMSSTWGGT